jgi:diadenosine tetraphosphate (Ap4A) HIT family hydrolase
MAQAHDCVFCRLVAGEIPASRVCEDELTLAFMDLGQLNPGHVLVALKRHAGDGIALAWPRKDPPRERLDAYAAQLRQALARPA